MATRRARDLALHRCRASRVCQRQRASLAHATKSPQYTSIARASLRRLLELIGRLRQRAARRPSSSTRSTGTPVKVCRNSASRVVHDHTMFSLSEVLACAVLLLVGHPAGAAAQWGGNESGFGPGWNGSKHSPRAHVGRALLAQASAAVVETALLLTECRCGCDAVARKPVLGWRSWNW